MKKLDLTYYQDEHVFNLDHITDQLPNPDDLTSDYLLDYKSQLERLLTVVTRKVSELILSHQPTYIDELQRIADLQKSITESIRVCTDGRRCLKYIKDGTTNGFTIIDHYRKRESLAKLLDSLTIISDLRKSVIETRSLIDDQEDFPRAIQMCKDGRALLAPYEKFECVNDLRSKLNDTIELIGERMDTVLSKMFISYDPEIYFKLNTAYAMMDRGEIAVGQLLMHFNAYHNSSVEELKMFLENDLWEMLPVKSDFTLVQLKEFSFLRESAQLNSSDSKVTRAVIIDAGNTSEDLFGDSIGTITTPYNKVEKQTSYFDKHEALPLDKISLSSDSDLDPELEKDFVDEDEPPKIITTPKSDLFTKHQKSSVVCDHRGGGDNGTGPTAYRLIKSSGPVLTNSSLNVLRLAGRYIQMMNVLTPITYEILMKVYKLLDVYTIFVFKKFGPSNDKQVGDVIASLRESLISPSGVQTSTIESASVAIFGTQPQHSSGQKEESMDAQRELSSKAVAIESLIFLVNQFWNLQEYLETLITPDQRIQLREQFSQSSHSMIPDFLKARAELGQFDD